MISHVSFATLNVTDMDRTKAFWSDVVGFEAMVDTETMSSMRWVMLRPDHTETQAHLWKDEAVQETRMPALPFVARLKAREVEIVKEPGPAEWDETTTYSLLRDSEGNTIMVGSK